MPCNHDACTTRYCPDCGKEINPPGPLHSLLKHLSARADALEFQHKSFLAQWEKLGGKSSDNERVVRNKDLARIASNHSRWSTWEEALAASLKVPHGKRPDIAPPAGTRGGT